MRPKQITGHWLLRLRAPVPGARWPSPLHRTRGSRPGRAGEIHGAGVAESRPPDTVPTSLGSFLSVSQDFAAQSGCARPSPVCLGSRAGAPLWGTPGASGGQPYPSPSPGLGLSSQALKKAGPDESSLLGTSGGAAEVRRRPLPAHLDNGGGLGRLLHPPGGAPGPPDPRGGRAGASQGSRRRKAFLPGYVAVSGGSEAPPIVLTTEQAAET